MKKLILSLVFISTISIQAGHHEMAKDAKSVVKKAYATFASGDTEAWTALHAKDLTFTVFGDIPTTGKHIGLSVHEDKETWFICTGDAKELSRSYLFAVAACKRE